MMQIGYIMIFGIMFLAIVIIGGYRYYIKQTMSKLNQIIDCAMQGNFEEEHFDESMLSALETKFAHYLASSSISAKKQQMEKDNIKSLIADISHQTKTPIANVLLYTQLLGEEELTENGHFYVYELETQAKKLQTLIEALVKTSRLETGVIALNPVSSRIDTVICAAVSQIVPKADEKQIKLIVESSDTKAVFDSKWTEEAIVNLLDNAIKYTQNGGKITVSVSEYQMFASINVKDYGPGISEEEQSKVFRRFYRGVEQQSKDGVGIGLYLVRQIAEGQGGYIRVQSSKGQGTVFSLYLPCD